jgi:omega-amidase
VRVHLVQLDIVWEDKAANHAKVDALLADAGVGAGDLVVLPELFDTGFSFNLDRTADVEPYGHEESREYVIELSRRLGAVVQGSLTALTHEQGERRGLNRALIADRGKVVAQYDKVHPFTFGREAEFFTGGTAVTTYRWPVSPAAPPLTVCPVICYDLRFPELFRIGLDLGAEVFAFGANWPAARTAHWRALAIARAIENQAYVFAVNRVGSDPTLSYAGCSLAISPKGEVLAEGDDRERVLSVEVDRSVLDEWRKVFPAWRDRSGVLREMGGKFGADRG